MHRIILACLFMHSVISAVRGQEAYFQQKVDYTIDVKLDEHRNSLTGRINIDYTNHSPDTLAFIWFHLWPNAYKNGETAFYQQLAKVEPGKEKDLTDPGYIDSLAFTVNGVKAKTEDHPAYIDVVRVILNQPLLPGQHAIISTPFHVKIPNYISRMGYQGHLFMISQWYPKPAVYDNRGWHPMPYLDQGEFYSEFGSFRVRITVPSQYVVAATGVLKNEEEKKAYALAGTRNAALARKAVTQHADSISMSGVFTRYSPPSKALFKTLEYTADSVHDFAWFADPDFVITTDTVLLPSGRTTQAFSFFHGDSRTEWYESLDFVEDAVRDYDSSVGAYPYPTVAAVEGPRNSSSGGMEYPMITLITQKEPGRENLDAVIAHEVGHNWFYGVLGSNERIHPWMDEGINSYYQFRYEAEKYRGNVIFGDALPAEVKKLPADKFLDLVYRSLSQVPADDPVDTEAPDFKNNEQYALVVYLKAATWMYLVELSVGKENMDRAMKEYYNGWKFRHPYPEDLRQSLEKSTGLDLSGLFALLKKQGSF